MREIIRVFFVWLGLCGCVCVCEEDCARKIGGQRWAVVGKKSTKKRDGLRFLRVREGPNEKRTKNKTKEKQPTDVRRGHESA